MKRERKLIVEEFSAIVHLTHSLSQIFSAISGLSELLMLEQGNVIPELPIINEKYYEAIEVFRNLRKRIEILSQILGIPSRLSSVARRKPSSTRIDRKWL